MSTQAVKAMAPADRAPGDRGVRGRVAALLVIGATLALMLTHFRSTTEGGGGSGAWQVQYTYHTPGWSTLGSVLAAAALVSGGTTLWLARSRRYVALAAVLATAGLGALAWTVATPNDTRITAATYRSVPLGAAQSALTGRLGAPFSTDASASRGQASIGCLLYRAAPSPATDADPEGTGLGAGFYLFCFDRDRLRVKESM